MTRPRSRGRVPFTSVCESSVFRETGVKKHQLVSSRAHLRISLSDQSFSRGEQVDDILNRDIGFMVRRLNFGGE
jgi:hypothetical protein